MATIFFASKFVQTLTAPNTHDLADEWLSKKEYGKGSTWNLKSNLSPADLYVYLKARFGPPNGVMMLARAPHSDNLIQWHYTLKSDSAKLEIVGFNTRTEFMISDYPNLSEADRSALVDAIKMDFGRLGHEMNNVRKELEKWRLFYNPYYRLEKTVTRYYEELSDLTKSDLELPADPPTHSSVFMPSGTSLEKAKMEVYLSRIRELSDKYSRAADLSASLRLLCPVWAEAFINFIIFILSRDEKKKDERLYQDYLRRDVDVRVKLLHVNCKGFVKPIDAGDQHFKNFQSLMNDRNDLLHGNIDPDKLSYETVFFDGTIPFFTEPQGLARNSLGVSLKGIEPEESVNRVETVRSFIDYTIGHLEVSYGEQLRLMLNKRELGWRALTKKIGILFPDYIAESFFY